MGVYRGIHPLIMKPTTKELEEELTRRRTKHNVKIGGTIIALNLDEMEEVSRQIEPFLKPAPVKREEVDRNKILADEWKKLEEAGKRLPYFPPPVNVPNWPSYPKTNDPWPQPDKIWCETKTS